MMQFNRPKTAPQLETNKGKGVKLWQASIYGRTSAPQGWFNSGAIRARSEHTFTSQTCPRSPQPVQTLKIPGISLAVSAALPEARHHSSLDSASMASIPLRQRPRQGLSAHVWAARLGGPPTGYLRPARRHLIPYSVRTEARTYPARFKSGPSY